MPKQKHVSESRFDLRVPHDWQQKLSREAEARDVSKNELVRSLVAEGLNRKDTYPLKDFVRFAPQSKCLYSLMVPGNGVDGVRAKVLDFGLAENLFQELANHPKLQEYIDLGADVMFFESQ